MEDCNIYTVQTQQRWAAAQAAGHFDAEICPVEIKKDLISESNRLMAVFPLNDF